ncbi:hypothetical protein FNB15_13170 [Ferrovibrio terrae]|uniref:Uncharacterized protein n=1 Tax=Ferrovibrio terrae TaxID=2594003 RepID=A0A516H307_9PROT|nr:hypothetical protein [Ferrovibrio terrae]QDO98162.1 hypothetical protein FNB15_13170 [Ferrovibrio terrae]
MQTYKDVALQTALLDRNTWMSAGKLIQVYGPQALARAAQEVEYCCNHGDAAAEVAWKRVTSAVVLLTSIEGQLPN